MPKLDTKQLINLSNIFEKSFCEVISVLSGIPLMKTDDDEMPGNFIGILPLSGDISGLFVISASDESLQLLTAYMTGQEEVSDADMQDCIGELANMACGLAKARSSMEGIAFTLSTPFSIKGAQDLEFAFKKNARVMEFPFVSPEISLNVRVILL